MAQVIGRSDRPGTKVLLGALIDEEPSGRRRYVEPLVLQGDDKNVEEVSMQPPHAWWGVPSGGGQNLKALQLVGDVPLVGMKRKNRALPRRAIGLEENGI